MTNRRDSNRRDTSLKAGRQTPDPVISRIQSSNTPGHEADHRRDTRPKRARGPRIDHSRSGGEGTWILRFGALSLLLILPVLGLHKLSTEIPAVVVALWSAIVSVVTVIFNWVDKSKAKKQVWRIPEKTLHTLELVGGWPAAFLIQRVLRHKISKGSYQFTFWCIVLLHQLLLWDYLSNWKWSAMAIAQIAKG